MKEFLITLLSVLLVSCIFNSIAIWMGVLPNLPPYPWPSGINGVGNGGAFGLKREDFAYPEIHFTAGSRSSNFITDISEKGNDRTADFPLGANN